MWGNRIMGKWNKVRTFIVAMMMVGSIAGLFITWQGTAHAADYIGEGSGMPSDPYQISNAVEFNDVRNHLDASFILTANIDLGAYNSDEGWVPIGTNLLPFIGTMDGGTYKIMGLRINRPTAAYYQGLFGSLGATGKLSNMIVEVDITATDWIGGLVGTNFG